MKQKILSKQEYQDLIDNYITKTLIKHPPTRHTSPQVAFKLKKR